MIGSRVTASTQGRIQQVDIARSLALAAMATYHFVYDLEAFGYLSPGTATSGFWAIFARCVAGSFLVLVGISLYLAHGRGIRWSRVWPRLARVAGAAALISGVTYVVLGPQMIFFGILHAITFGTLAGLLFLRLPWAVILIAGAAVVTLPFLQRFDFFASPFLIWTGLGTRATAAADFVPVFPWFGAVLVGISLAKALDAAGVWTGLAATPSKEWHRRLAWPGRHSLAVYLVHQPILIGLLWLYAKAVG
jgi:uncharacterized membrane protein